MAPLSSRTPSNDPLQMVASLANSGYELNRPSSLHLIILMPRRIGRQTGRLHLVYQGHLTLPMR
jgi:hypothetical protein